MVCFVSEDHMYNCNEVDVSKSGHFYNMAAPTVRVSNKSVSCPESPELLKGGNITHLLRLERDRAVRGK